MYDAPTRTGGRDDKFYDFSGCRIRRFCVCGFRVNFMRNVGQTGTRAAVQKTEIEIGLYYYRARYYDQSAGRFLSEDPVGFSAGVDFYTYVINNSTNLIDPKGLLQICCRPAHQGWFSVYTKLTLQPPPCHCFLKTSDGHTLGGYFSRSLRTFGALVTKPDDYTDYIKYASEANCKDVPGKSCENDARAKNAFGGPKNLGGWGIGSDDAGTSNDATAQILRDAGFGYTLPPCAYGKGPGGDAPDTGVHMPLLPPRVF
jgi:RHS repeat-associated protein